MAEGFKKYFNGTTMAGRANVAKATYATLALVYLFYRVRRGSSQAPLDSDPNAQPSCSCDEKHPHSDSAVAAEPPERDCAVCRERRPRDEGCNGHDEPPPPPPSSSSAPPRRKCPCEDPHRHSDSSKQHSQSHQQQQHAQQQRQNCSSTEVDEAHPARELILQMQEAASRVLRNVIGAVTGETPAAASSSGDENCSCCTAAAAAAGGADMLDGGEQADDDNCDYESDNQLLNRQRRTAPRACVPSNTSSDPELVDQSDQASDAQAQAQAKAEQQQQLQHQQQQPSTQSQNQPQLQTASQSQSQGQARFRCFDDDFASEMFFEDYEE